ncbi:unnamed protein product [Brachionus calyciflorus]|uniref:BEN domain-containing protein n=1 Tax=Brachionus calyciflorus TaxID=104777 RepID=A0A813WQH0_9BILA|nr:unnamed protein product [Brachionus calyciflorus]
MGRLSTFAKNRILNLRFQKSYRIKQIANTLFQEDNIKVSRKSISTFLKKYIETKSINDKPRSGRNKKLTPEEINLIGEVTRLNRDITAPKIKEYLNLNVSTYTILRASKLFEWNKLNPNSNEAKKAAALERQMTGSEKKRKGGKRKNSSLNKSSNSSTSLCSEDQSDSNQTIKLEPMLKEPTSIFPELPPDANLNLIPETEVLLTKNISSSPMVFATKILYKIFKLDELIGHNRINYIRWLVENYFEAESKDELWKSCRTAINKSIRNNEIKFANAVGIPANNFDELQQNLALSEQLNHHEVHFTTSDFTSDQNNSINQLTNSDQVSGSPTGTIINLQPNLSLFQITNDLPPNELDELHSANDVNIKLANHLAQTTSIVRLTDEPDISAEFIQQDDKVFLDLTKSDKMDTEGMVFDENNNEYLEHNDENKLCILSEPDILELKNLCCCSPMIFSTKVLLKIFTKEELIGHNVSGKTFHKNLKNKQPLDEDRIDYIRHLVEKYFPNRNIETVWKSCRKAINRVIRNFEIKESRLIKSIEDDLLMDADAYDGDNLDKSNDDSEIEMFSENNANSIDRRSSSVESFNLNSSNL